MAIDKIVIKGAREHNLKDIDVEIPRDKLVVFTGLSGSGKSSLAFDTIYADGQRRYVESLSSDVYKRQYKYLPFRLRIHPTRALFKNPPSSGKKQVIFWWENGE